MALRITVELTSQTLTIVEYTLQDGDNLTVGRDPRNEISVDDITISRLHAVIARRGDTLLIWDKGSRNGILVNGAKVQSARLKNGDVIRLGAKHFLKVSIIKPKKGESTITAEHNLN